MDLATALAEHWEPHPYPEDRHSLRDSLAAAARTATDHAAGAAEPSAQRSRVAAS